MAETFQERRRFPRVAVTTGAPVVELPLSATVQLVDISQAGVLLATPQKLAVGQRGRLRTRIGNEPIAVQVEVRRVAAGPSGRHGPWRVGAEFVGLDEDTQKKVDRFLKVDA